MRKASTIFKNTIKSPLREKHVIKRSTNRKLGKVIQRGKWKGFPTHTVTFEERKTCPTSCFYWKNCYGNNMRWAHRIDTSDQKALLKKMQSDLVYLSKKYPKGYAVRLHVLGDFISTEYVEFWRKSLEKYSNLYIWGYTAWPKTSRIGSKVDKIKKTYLGSRFRIRYSGGASRGISRDTADPIGSKGRGFVCPEQQAKSPIKTCAECALCWSTKTPVKWILH